MTPEMLTTLTEQVAELVQTYSNNYPQFQRATYNETQVRVDFVNRFFKLLGWDVDNERGLPQHLREVTHEATVVVEEDGVHRSKKPDYSFKVGTEVLYFLETKKPAVNLTIDAAPAFQLRRYGWSGNLKVSVLTNFTDLYIYDCSVRPREGDDIGIAMIIHRYISAPTDYKILWADIGSFGGYPAGVVITDRAMIAKASREETKNIVREGKLTYNQALNLAKAGTIESITFDAYTGAVNCLSVFVCLLLPLLHRLIG